MMQRVQELCRKLKPVLGSKVDRLWAVYLAESDAEGKADIEQMLELLAAKHLGQSYEPDRSPFPPPPKKFSLSGDIRLGSIVYGSSSMYPFFLRSLRLKEHLLVAGRSGSGKTNLTFILMNNIMASGIKVLALDWKRGYRDLVPLRSDLQVYTIGREVSSFRFNPLIPPPGCEVSTWGKLIIDVIATSYLGGEGVISLLTSGLDQLYREYGAYEGNNTHWPTMQELLVWLRTVKLKGRAAMWQASAERILLAMSYGEFAAVVSTQDNRHVEELLDHNVVFEMDGLSSNSDRVMFSEALTLYLYRYRLVRGPQEKLTNLIVLEEAHNLLLAKPAGSKESVLETSIRMIRQYGIGYVFIDQSASLLSKVAFANSYATIALSQKLRADIQTMAGAMNLSDEQKEALNTLPIGTAVVRLADQYPEPFLIRVPRSSVQEGSVSDAQIQARMMTCFTKSTPVRPLFSNPPAITPIPVSDKINHEKYSHPPSPRKSALPPDHSVINPDSHSQPPQKSSLKMTPESLRFLADIVAHPLSTTVTRYERLHLSRRRGNAIRQDLMTASVIEPVTLATRSGQVVLFQLTAIGREQCSSLGIDPGPRPRASLEHTWWAIQTKTYFERQGYEVDLEHPVEGNGVVDLLAQRPGEKIAVEIETGKSDIRENLNKLSGKGFDRVILLATSPAAVAICQKRLKESKISAELLTWLDIS
jgi:energy-coupling factor transporter ATP-binding protein EcfA2